MSIIDKEWMPVCSMKRIICHWTAGGYKATELDREHYHLLIEEDGNLVRGVHSILDNVSTADGKYAAHTKGCNTGSIGISVCCMAGAQQSPFKPGKFPMTEMQWETMTQVAAELCQAYNIQVTPKTVLGHGEVHAHLGIPQLGKWDPMVLPWNPAMSQTQVGNLLRTLVQNILTGSQEPEETPPVVQIVIDGTIFTEGALSNGESFVKARPVANAFGWTIKKATGSSIELVIGGKTHTLPMILINESGYIDCSDLAEALGKEIKWDGATRRVVIR